MATLRDGNIASFEVGLALAVVIMFGGKISGGHFNPAVSIMMLFRKLPDFRIGECIGYIISQILGGICAFYFISSSISSNKSKKNK